MEQGRSLYVNDGYWDIDSIYQVKTFYLFEIFKDYADSGSKQVINLSMGSVQA